MGLSGKDVSGVQGRKRKTLAEKFETENRSLIRAAEKQVRGTTSIGDLMVNLGKIPFHEVISASSAEKGAWETLSQSKFVSLLRRASSDLDTESFKCVLLKMLKQWEIVPPAGTFTRMKAVPGAPLKRVTEEIRACWEQEGKPSITGELCSAYAERFYTPDYRKAKSKRAKKTLTDRVRTPLLNYQQMLASTNSPSRNS